MNIEEINARLLEIRTALDEGQAGLDLDALEAEATSLLEQRTALQSEATRRQELRSRVAAGAGQETRNMRKPTVTTDPEIRGVDSVEYRRAFLLELAGRREEMSHEERAAFVHTTANTTAPLPTTMLNQIWDLVSKQHCIMQDITIYRTGTILEVVKHTAIAQGAAKTVAENTANDDEQNTTVKVTLSGKDFSKHVEISYAMERMSIDALESYLVQEISRGLGEALADDIVATIRSGIATDNKVTTSAVGAVTYGELANLFGRLARVGTVSVYATRSTIYTHLVAMVDSTGRPIFQPSLQAGQQGVLLGAAIKIEDSVGDGKLLIGDGSKVLYNMIQDIMIETDRDIKTHKVIHSGYARGSGTLIDEKAFAELTIKSA